MCTPMAAAGRWLGVILSDRGPDRPPLRDAERYLLWTLGKTAALAALRPPGHQQAGPGPPAAGAHRPRARGARGRDPAPVRRPARVLQPGRAQPGGARADRRRAAGRAVRPAARAAAPARPRRAGDAHDAAGGGRAAAPRAPRPATSRSRPGSERVRRARASSSRSRSRCWPRPSATPTSTPRPTRVEVSARDHATTARSCSTSSTTACAAGAPSRPAWACKLAALEALQVGGIVEFGEREPGTWRVRLAVPVDRP